MQVAQPTPTPGPEQSQAVPDMAVACVSTTSTPARLYSPAFRLQEGLVPIVLHEAAGGEQEAAASWRQVGAPAAAGSRARTRGPRAHGWIWTAIRARSDTTAGLAGAAPHLFLPNCLVLAIPLLRRTPPSWPAAPPVPLPHSEVPGHAQPVCTGEHMPWNILPRLPSSLSSPATHLQSPLQAFPPPSAQTQGPRDLPSSFFLLVLPEPPCLLL